MTLLCFSVPGLVLGPGISLAFPAAEVGACHLALGAQWAARVVATLGRRLATAKAVEARRLCHVGARQRVGLKIGRLPHGVVCAGSPRGRAHHRRNTTIVAAIGKQW